MKRIVSATAALTVALLGGCSTEEPVEDVTITPAWVERFETSLGREETRARYGVRPLETYARHYQPVRVDNVALVEAIYVPPLTRPPEDQVCLNGGGEPVDCGPGPSEADLLRHGPGVHIGEPAWNILDGGCGMVTMRIDPETLEVREARCNGR